jgi:hypothetical protein
MKEVFAFTLVGWKKYVYDVTTGCLAFWFFILFGMFAFQKLSKKKVVNEYCGPSGDKKRKCIVVMPHVAQALLCFKK